MNLQKYKALLIIIAGTLALILASPVLQRLLVYPQTEFFTEMWLLDPEHMAENYPFKITLGENYNGFLGIANHLGHDAHYMIQVKFRTQTQSAADSFTPSSLPSLYDIKASVADKEKWEIPISFSFNYVQDSYNATHLQVRFLHVTFNNNVLNLNGFVV